MSIKRMTAVWDNSQQKAGYLLALIALADYARDNGICWPSMATLAKKARVSERTVLRYLDKIEDDGEIFALRRRNRGNYYIVLAGFTPEQTKQAITELFEWQKISDKLSVKWFRKKSREMVKCHMCHLITDKWGEITDTAMSDDPLDRSVSETLIATEKTPVAPPENHPEPKPECFKCAEYFPGRCDLCLENPVNTLSGEENPPQEQTETSQDEPTVPIEKECAPPPKKLLDPIGFGMAIGRKRQGISDTAHEPAILAHLEAIKKHCETTEIMPLPKRDKEQWDKRYGVIARDLGADGVPMSDAQIALRIEALAAQPNSAYLFRPGGTLTRGPFMKGFSTSLGAMGPQREKPDKPTVITGGAWG